MARTRDGQVYEDKDGRIYARVQYIDAQGKTRDVKRRAKNRTEAKEKIQQILNEVRIGGVTLLDGERLTFKQLAEKYREAKLQEATYVNGRKVSGMRSLKGPRQHLQTLIDYFGNARLRSITHGEIEQFKIKRLETKTIHERQRSIASVNRELEVLRAVLHYAHREGLILSNPFQRGKSLISKADETHRDRILTLDEEKRLLKACHNDDNARRAHLRPIIICALDTAMRKGEIAQLTWPDVNLLQRTITIRATTTKTLRPRTVGITARLSIELQALYAADKEKTGLVFKVADWKKSFISACEEAKIEDLHFHDLRHVAITRMIQANMPPALVMKVSGHTQMATFARYVNPNAGAANDIAMALDNWQQQTIVASAVIN